jgi:hypothetical protein
LSLTWIGLGGCSGGLSPDDVRIRTDRSAYTAPTVATVTVRNEWDEDLYLSSCAYPERWDGAQWTGPLERVCPDDLVQLSPGEEHQFPRGLGQGTIPGTYRMRVPIGRESTPFEVVDETFVSNTFTVEAGSPED